MPLLNKPLIKRACINKCGHKVMLEREKHGQTPSKECGYCRTYGKERAKEIFRDLQKQLE